MNRILISMLLAATASLSATAETWTLDSCISYAIAHNITVKQRELGVQQAEQAITDAKSRYLPNVSAGVGQNWNLGRGLTSQNIYADRNTSQLNWNASFSLPLFTGLANERQLAYAKANLMQVTEQYEAAKDDISINVITAYLQVLYASELHQVAQQQIELSEYEIQRQQALLDAGKIPEVDMLEAQSQLANDRLSAAQTYNDWVMARVDLIQLLRLDVEPEEFNVAPLAEDSELIMSADEAYDLALQYNHTIAAAHRSIDMSHRNVELAKTGYYPTLSFNGGLGSSYYQISGMTNDSFGDQMKHNYSTYFGLSLNIPIFDAFGTRNQVRRARLEQINAELQLDEAQQQLYRAIQQAYYQAKGAQEKLQASIVAEQSALKSFDAMREKYNIGRATPTEYEQAKTKALRATAERIQANYELILRTRLLRHYASGA